MYRPVGADNRFAGPFPQAAHIRPRIVNRPGIQLRRRLPNYGAVRGELPGAEILPLPPLRARAKDVPDLVRHFVNHYCSEEGLAWRDFPTAVMNALIHQPWPGNVRELRQRVYQLLIAGGETEVRPLELERLLRPPAPAAAADGGLEPLVALPFREARTRFERAYYRHHLDRCGGNMRQLADSTGMERTYLYRKLKELELRRPLLDGD